MKIRNLVQHTGVSKETVHFYIREGLLPKPLKRGRNIAEYDDSYVERIRFIKELQDRHFLPLAVIKNILKKQKNSSEWQSLLNLRKEYFRPIDQFLPNEVAGEELFLKATGLGKKWLVKMEEWEIITPEVRNGQKVYSQDDITLGKLIVEMDSIGLGAVEGFDPEALKRYRDKFREIVIASHKHYIEVALGKLIPEEFSKRVIRGREIMSIFFYHLYRKLSREEYRKILALLESGKRELQEGDLDSGGFPDRG
ncbi:MAG TPA: MerR family transcriptional regulator [Thermodesulfobacteriota bacterium]|nr:MerR family transcriptional regulator [Thermodesulfobacteriota bacterium]